MVEFSEIKKILNDISMELKRSNQRHPIEGIEDLEKKITLVKKKIEVVRDSNMSLQSSVFSINNNLETIKEENLNLKSEIAKLKTLRDIIQPTLGFVSRLTYSEPHLISNFKKEANAVRTLLLRFIQK